MTSTDPQRLIVRWADLAAESDDIRAIWLRNLRGYDPKRAADKLRLGYLANPAEGARVALLCPKDGGAPVGTMGQHARSMVLGATSVSAIGLADFSVDAEHRTLGPAVLLARTTMRDAMARAGLVYGQPNARAAAVMRFIGLNLVAHWQRYAKPLRLHPWLRRWLTSRMSGPARRLIGTLAAVVATFDRPVMAAVDTLLMWRCKKAGVAGPRLRCEAARWDDPAIDALWARRRVDLLLGERSAAMLAWRFGAEGRLAWQLAIGRDRTGAPHGLVVWRDRDSHIEVGDFMAAPLDPQMPASRQADAPRDATAALVLAFARMMRRRGAAPLSLENCGSPDIARSLALAGCHLRPQRMPLYAIGPLADRPIEGWHLTSFDVDED
jgi:hypothetical protein